MKGLIIGGGISMVIAAACLPRLGAGTVASSSQHGNMRIVAESERIYRLMTGLDGGFSTSFAEFTSHPYNGSMAVSRSRVLIWNEAGNKNVALDWEAGADEPNNVSCSVLGEDTTIPVLNKLDAAHWMLYWLKALGIATATELWRLAEGPDLQGFGVYTARWMGPGKEASVSIHCQTGALNTLRVRHFRQ